jgi:hypothetical protein
MKRPVFRVDTSTTLLLDVRQILDSEQHSSLILVVTLRRSFNFANCDYEDKHRYTKHISL